MSEAEKKEIVRISKLFAAPFKEMIGEINGSGWLIVDPLSAYLNHCGYENTLDQLPAKGKHPQILIMNFKDGSKLIPAGLDLKDYFGKKF